MSSLKKAALQFVKNPTTNASKIYPYLVSHAEPYKRKVAEFFGVDTFSKPYSGHTELISEINIKDGYYVVCGGNDGYGFDPTYYLERFRGWSGLIVEPIPESAKRCRFNRPNSHVVEFALVSRDYTENTITLYNCNFMSLTSESSYNIEDWISSGEKAQNIQTTQISVPAKTLDAVLDTYLTTSKKIDLLVIDVEGSEEAVLNGFALEKYLPTYVLIEIHTQDLRSKIEERLLKNYALVKVIGNNDHLYKLSLRSNN